jgi:hypothetical protein
MDQDELNNFKSFIKLWLIGMIFFFVAAVVFLIVKI